MKRVDYYFYYNGVVHVHTDHTLVPEGQESVRVDCDIEKCYCDCVVRIKRPKERTYVSRRKIGNIARSVDDMQNDILAQIAHTWFLDGRVPVETIDKRALDSAYVNVKCMTSPNFVEIPPYFNFRGVTPSATLHMPVYLAEMYRKYDIFYMSKILGRPVSREFMMSIWQQTRQGGTVIPHSDGFIGIPWEWEETSVPRLTVLAARKASVYNSAFGGSDKGPNCVYTLTQALAKLPKVYSKLCKPTHTVYSNAKFLGNLTGRAMKMMIKALRVKEYARKKIWTFEEAFEDSRKVPRFSSAGIRAGNEIILSNENYVFRGTCKGKKAHQLDRSDEVIRAIYKGIIEDKDDQVIPDRAWALIEKNEVLCGMTQAECDKNQGKCRLYNIPTVVTYRIAKMVHGYRQVIERGSLIAIGMNFWSGGAWLLASRFHAMEEGYTYYSGDFSALDTTIKASLLQLYSAFSDYYYKKMR
jgi:hypothetical protein